MFSPLNQQHMIADTVRMIRHCQSDQPGESYTVACKIICSFQATVFRNSDFLFWTMNTVQSKHVCVSVCVSLCEVEEYTTANSFFYYRYFYSSR